MKTTYELASSDILAAILANDALLKQALISWMNAAGKPVSGSDSFTVDSSGNVTIVATDAPAATVASAPAPVSVAVQPVVLSAPQVPAPALDRLPDGTWAKAAQAAVAPLAGHMVVSDPPMSATGIDTEFGYQDPGDNGIGFFTDPATGKPYDTNNKFIVGISLPREVLMSTFGVSDDWRTQATLAVWEQYAGAVQAFAKTRLITANVDGGGKSLRGIPLVDAGPTRTTGNLIDLTEAAAVALGTGGKAVCTFELLADGVPLELKGIDFVKGIVG
jgi:hypothetical protein